MNKIPFHTKIIKSITDPAFVSEGRKHSTGSVLIYILLLILIFSSLNGIVRGYVFTKDIDTIIDIVDSPTFPDFELINGTFTIDSEEPIVVSESEDFIFIADTTGMYTINDLKHYDVGYLITDSTLIINATNQEPQYVDLDRLSGFPLSKELLISSLNISSHYGMIFYVIFHIIAVYFVVAFRSLVLFLLGLVLKQMLRLNNLTKSSIYKIVLYSSTIGIILLEVLNIIPDILPIPILRQLLFTAGGVLFFYLPVSTMISRTFRYVKAHEDLDVIKNLNEQLKEQRANFDKEQEAKKNLENENISKETQEVTQEEGQKENNPEPKDNSESSDD